MPEQPMPGSIAPLDRNPLTSDASAEPSLTSLYRAAIGPVNTDYYLPVFTGFETVGRAGSSWNWSACLCTLSWLAFRNLWAAALVYVATVLTMPLLLLGVGRWLFGWSETVEMSALLLCLTLAFVLPGMFGNAIFQKKSRQRMNMALSVSATLDEACDRLYGDSSTRKRLIWIVVINTALVSTVLSAGALLLTRTAQGLIPLQKTSPAIPTSEPSPPPIKADVLVQLTASASTSPLIVPVEAPNPAASDSIPTSKPLPAIPTSAPVPAKPLPAIPTSAPMRAKRLPADSAHFFVNVGLFATASNAKNAHARVVAAGLPALSQSINTSKGALTRVRAGPFETSSEAKEAIKRIEALGLDAKLVQP